jgi:hypothetical protein
MCCRLLGLQSRLEQNEGGEEDVDSAVVQEILTERQKELQEKTQVE